MWQRSGDKLRLTNSQGTSVALHAAGSALNLVGQQWVLKRYNAPQGESHESNYAAAPLRIDAGGTVHASDLCNNLAGSATATDMTVTFAGMHSTDRVCAAPASTSASSVVDHVLSGSDTYVIRGAELIINGHRRGLLIYIPDR